VRGDADVGKQVGEPAPPVGRLESDPDRFLLEFAEHPEELVRSAGDPPACEHLPVAGEHSDVRGLAVQVHSDVDHDRASFLSFVLGGRYDVHVVNTGAEARSFMASEVVHIVRQ
jgi:hypothetical protein